LVAVLVVIVVVGAGILTFAFNNKSDKIEILNETLVTPTSEKELLGTSNGTKLYIKYHVSLSVLCRIPVF
jgi:hypothetical protein